MTGTAQIKHPQSWAGFVVCPLAALCALVLVADEVSPHYFGTSEHGIVSAFLISTALPISAALLSYSLSAFYKKNLQRHTANLFLFFFSLPAFFFTFSFIALASSQPEARILSKSFLTLSFTLLAWTVFNITAYLTYTRLVQISTPRLNSVFKWLREQATLKNFLLILPLLLLVYGSYAMHPRAYFYYQLFKAEGSDSTAQMWVAKAYEIPSTRRLFGGMANYTQKNFYKARDWYEKAAEKGNTLAYNRLSVLYLYQPEIVNPKETRDHLEIALGWAKKAENKHWIAHIEKIIQTPPHKREYYRSDITNFSGMSSSPVYASSGFGNLFASLFWLVGCALLNTAIFFALYRLLRRRYIRQVIFIALTWPMFLGILYTLPTIIFSEKPFRYVEVTLFFSVSFILSFSLCMLRYITILRRTPHEQQQAKAKKTALIYTISGFTFLTLPSIANYIPSGLYNIHTYSGYLNLVLTVGWIVSAAFLLWTAYCVRKHWRKAETLTKKEKIKSLTLIFIYILIATGLMALPSLLAESCYIH